MEAPEFVRKPFYKSKVFIATLAIEGLLTLCFWMVLKSPLPPDVQQSVLSTIDLTMGFVALCYISPMIAHDVLTRLPLSRAAGSGGVTLPPPASDAILGAADDHSGSGGRG